MKTYDKIMESSYRLFLEKGFHEVSWADISEEAEISPGTLYYYFKTKDELVLAVLDTYVLEYYYDFLNNHQIALACGMALNKSFYNNYEKNFSINNVTLQYTYNLQVNWWTLPLKAALIYNPYCNKFYFTASAYFGF